MHSGFGVTFPQRKFHFDEYLVDATARNLSIFFKIFIVNLRILTRIYAKQALKKPNLWAIQVWSHLACI